MRTSRKAPGRKLLLRLLIEASAVREKKGKSQMENGKCLHEYSRFLLLTK